jgi:serine/threonine protein kinase
MGVVYLAQDTQLQRQVALKIPQLEATTGSARLERFYREARLAATLSHPNICAVHDVGQIQGTHYISMAYISGKALGALLKPGKPQPERTAATLVRKIALAIHEAHGHGVVHRDLKPANIMIDQRGEPIVMDFGLARQMNGAEQAQITHNGAIIGTPSYMSPEQVQGNTDEVGPASDIYGLGVILYQLLTGRLPFQGTQISVLAQIVTQTPAPPSSFRQQLSPVLEAICLQAMAKRPADRFGSMAELAGALSEYLKAGRGTEDRGRSTVGAGSPECPVAPPDEGIALQSSVDSSAAARSSAAVSAFGKSLRANWRGLSRRKRLVGAIAGAALVVLALVMRSSSEPDNTTFDLSGKGNGEAQIAAGRPKIVEIDFYEPPGLAGEWRPMRDSGGNVIPGGFPVLSRDNLELMFITRPRDPRPACFDLWYTRRDSVGIPFGEPVSLGTIELRGSDWLPTFSGTNWAVCLRGVVTNEKAGAPLPGLAQSKWTGAESAATNDASLRGFPNAWSAPLAVFSRDRRVAVYDAMGSDVPSRAIRRADGGYEVETVDLPNMIANVQSDITPTAVGNDASVVFTMDVKGGVWLCVARTSDNASSYGPPELLLDLHSPTRGGCFVGLSRDARLVLSHDNLRELTVMRLPEETRRKIVAVLNRELSVSDKSDGVDEEAGSATGTTSADESTDAESDDADRPRREGAE